MSAEFDLSRARRVDLEMVHVDLITRTNSDIDTDAVARMVKEGIDPERLGVLPAYRDSERWIITDGNHRFLASRICGIKHVPVAPLTKEEYDLIAFSKTRTVDLLVQIPDDPKYHNL